ncbi:hypothetical protein DAVIS_04840 [Mycobacterium marinum]|uniref:Uncharacterized protein n=2 Tax=Mycobacterium marinum TaxID=1781 RepID=A0A3E2MPN2_MYCMR|nr:hypothetical protein DAVIS_04840 [Mycobacterium marinum]
MAVECYDRLIFVISRWVMENRRVEREYSDEGLRRLALNPEFRPADWTDREIRDFHRLIQCARAAHVETDLRNMRLLRIEPDHSGDPTRAQATLSSGRIIDLAFKNSENHGAVVFGVLAVEMEPQR